MATEAQIAANRRNALLSTGPKSRKGKDKSRSNALRHGLYAGELMALGEDGEAFSAHAAALAAALQPHDTYEALLVRRVALASWRGDRLARLEAALLDGEARTEAHRRGHPAELPGDVWPAALTPLARHEAALDRALQRAMTLLERHRAARRRGDLPSPAPVPTPPFPANCSENSAERSQIPEPLQRPSAGEANEEANLPVGETAQVTVPGPAAITLPS